jgi:mannose-6-phosphate isomerase-like protein (cupin superfamily)
MLAAGTTPVPAGGSSRRCTRLGYRFGQTARERAVSIPTFAEFDAAARARAFDEVLEREWAPGTIVDTHTHPFDVDAVVVRGEMWLTVGDAMRHLTPGDTFALARDVPHAERYGPEGAAYWVARRNT